MCRSQKRKNSVKLSRSALLGSWRVKAASKMLIKSTPGVNFNNILPTPFGYENVLRSFYLPAVLVCNFLQYGNQYKSC